MRAVIFYLTTFGYIDGDFDVDAQRRALASILVGRVYPEIVQRFTVDPNPLVKEEQYLLDNISMTRLAYGLGSDWTTTVPYGGDARLSQAQIDEEGAPRAL